MIHLSSAAVQGRRPVLDESAEVEPFSPYSRSKALGERAALAAAEVGESDLIVVRATSVQGNGRATTDRLRRIARSPFSSVSAPGTQPTVVSSLPSLTEFVRLVGMSTDALPQILLQPWEGLSVSDVMRLAGGRDPHVLPGPVCSGALAMGRIVGRVLPEVAGLARRIELMWIGQAQTCSAHFPECAAHIRSVLEPSEQIGES